MTTKPNLQGVSDALDAAETYVPDDRPATPMPEKTAPAAEPRCKTELDPAPGEANAQGEGPGTWLPNKLGLPDDCPVTPLGHNGDAYYFLDTAGQLRVLKAKDFSKLMLTSLFQGRYYYLYWAWPRFSKEGKCTSFHADEAAAGLMAACDAVGAWSPLDRVRGRGAWLGAKGDLILHTGNALWIYGREQTTGVLGRYVYPRQPTALEPWPTRIDDLGNPAELLLPMLRRWHWARPDLDPVLMLGWIGAAMIGGALKWRPIVWLTGDRGTGKSTLQEIVKGLFGDGILSTSDTTAAGIYQTIGRDSLPVAIDEAEAEDDNRRIKSLIKLARAAASGSSGHRGSDGGVANTFAVRSAFCLSSINIPPLQSSDRSRMALLHLKPIDPTLPPPTVVSEAELKIVGREVADGGELSEEDLARLGQMILRRMMDTFGQLSATFDAYREVLRDAGHDQRGQDTFGILLACANLLVGESFEHLDVPMGEDLSIWRDRLKVSGMAEFEDDKRNWRACLSRLLTTPVDHWRGGSKVTIGRVIEDFYDKTDAAMTLKEVREKLEQGGVTMIKPDEMGGPHWLVVPHFNPALSKLFQGTVWAGDGQSGGWAHALRQGPEGTLWTARQARVSGDKGRCVCISLDALYGPGGIMADDSRDKH